MGFPSPGILKVETTNSWENKLLETWFKDSNLESERKEDSEFEDMFDQMGLEWA